MNAAILDVAFALEFIQEHIRKFGGDPRKVTITGESAGGGAVMLLAIANNGTLGTSLFLNVSLILVPRLRALLICYRASPHLHICQLSTITTAQGQHNCITSWLRRLAAVIPAPSSIASARKTPRRSKSRMRTFPVRKPMAPGRFILSLTTPSSLPYRVWHLSKSVSTGTGCWSETMPTRGHCLSRKLTQ